MTRPMNVRIDRSVMAAYVEYVSAPSVSTVDLNETGSVAYDVDVAGNVVGIEIIGFNNSGRISIAQGFAESHDLAFPRSYRSARHRMTETPVETRKEYLTRKKREQRAAAKAAGLCGVCAKTPVSGKATCEGCIAAIVEWQRSKGWP